MNRTVSKTKYVVPPGTVGSNPTLSVLSLPDGLPGVGYRTEVLASGRIWERCESGRIGTPGERVFTMWTVGSNPTLSVEYRGNPDPERRGRQSFRSAVVFRGSSSVGRAPESQSGGRRFDSALLHSRGRERHEPAYLASRNTECGTITVVLDGELAVPCNPQSATAGSNSHPKDRTCVAGICYSRY